MFLGTRRGQFCNPAKQLSLEVQTKKQCFLQKRNSMLKMFLQNVAGEIEMFLTDVHCFKNETSVAISKNGNVDLEFFN